MLLTHLPPRPSVVKTNTTIVLSGPRASKGKGVDRCGGWHLVGDEAPPTPTISWGPSALQPVWSLPRSHGFPRGRAQYREPFRLSAGVGLGNWPGSSPIGPSCDLPPPLVSCWALSVDGCPGSSSLDHFCPFLPPPTLHRFDTTTARPAANEAMHEDLLRLCSAEVGFHSPSPAITPTRLLIFLK